MSLSNQRVIAIGSSEELPRHQLVVDVGVPMSYGTLRVAK
jgi:hypothetical protein